MTDKTTSRVMTEAERQAEKLVALRVPFEENHIAHKPQPTKEQNDEVKKDYTKGARCPLCGGWHHPKAQHLQYVGHAALTSRLLDVDPLWDWQPLSFDPKGLPALDGDGGLWIRLTVAGVTRLGYGDAGDKTGPNAMKERIGDALRNAGMRFGMALDLWHKGVLELEPERFESHAADKWIMKAGGARDLKTLEAVWVEGSAEFIEKSDRAGFDALKIATNARKAELTAQGGEVAE